MQFCSQLKSLPSREDVAEVDEKFPLYNGEGLPHCFLLDTWGICFDVVCLSEH